MSAPIRPDFWRILHPTLAPARAAGRAYLEADRYVKRIDEREYRESDQGWPLVVADRVFAKGPPNWRFMFSTKPGQFSYVLVDNVPELKEGMKAAIGLAERDSQFAEGLSYLHHVKDREQRTAYLEDDFLSIVGDILGRAEALGVTGDSELLDIYLQVEKGRFASELTGDIVVPLVLTAFDATEPIRLFDDFWLEPLDEAAHRARALDSSQYEPASPLIAAAATHAIVQRNQSFRNTMWPPQIHRGVDLTPVSLETVNRVLESIHIVTGKQSGYAQVLVRSESWVSWHGWINDLPHIWKAATMKVYPNSINGGWMRPMEPIPATQISEVAAVLTALIRSPKNVQLAARRCFRSTFREDIEDEILDATIGIEALLSHGRDELTHRMSLRAATALAGEFRTDAIYEILKQVYAQRSQIVHGTIPKNSKVRFGDSEFWTNHMGVFLLRHLLRSYLLSDDPWTPAALDTLMIERLGRINLQQEH